MTQSNHEFPPLFDCWYLTGATATGKSQIAIQLANAINAEIISMDSMAVYAGMDIGTAKPTAQHKEEVPHHLLDVVEPNQEFSLAEYLELAHQTVSDIRARKKQVLFVGGTPLYLKSLLRGVSEGPPADETFRREVEAEVAEVGLGALRSRLQQIDPLSAARLHPNDKRRMIRALEVYKLTGQPISHYQLQSRKSVPSVASELSPLVVTVRSCTKRINDRTETMFASGFVDEVQGLKNKYSQLSKTAVQGVGYREVWRFLDGETTIEAAIEQTKIRTRRFARRQETWFRGLDECQWIKTDGAEFDPESINRIAKAAS